MTEQRRPRDVVDAEGAAGEPLFIAHHQPHRGVETPAWQTRGRWSAPAAPGSPGTRPTDKAHPASPAGSPSQKLTPAFMTMRHGVRADAEERGVAERLLPRVAHRQVQPHGGDDEDQPVGEQVDAVALDASAGGQQDEQRQSRAEDEMKGVSWCVLRLRLCAQPSCPAGPCGLNKMTSMKMTSATASL